jgi:hopanoid biosynthesis associated RND transporter like protein HpnN
MSLPSVLAAVVGHSRRHPGVVVLVALGLAILSIWYGAGHLGVSTNTDEMFPASLPWRQQQMAMEQAFPQTTNLLVAVVDARLPEEADATAAALASKLAADKAHFISVRRPDSNPYLQREGLLFLDTQQLTDLLNQTISAQPFLGQLAADPSARGLFAALGLLAVGVEHGQTDLSSFAGPLQGFRNALEQAAKGHPQPLSWQNLLAGPVAKLAGQYRFVLAKIRPDFTSFQPGQRATEAMRADIAQLPFVQDGSARVRITGQAALADAQFSTVAQGMIVGTIASFVLIALWLFLAVKSWRLIAPIMLTLLLGLSLTLGFASVAVGRLNLVSVAFAILFVGIAVDFAIQFSVRFRERLYLDQDTDRALTGLGRRVGPQILVAAAATACGFLAFVPTDFQGVAELGLIAGTGMGIAFLCTVVFLPAALTLFRPPPERAAIGFAILGRFEQWLTRLRVPVLAAFGLIALAGVVCLSLLTFDSDPLDTQDPNTEAMRTLRDLISSPVADPYTAQFLRPSLAAADAAAAQLRKQSLVRTVLTLSSFVPDDQDEKLAAIQDAASIMMPTLTPGSPAAPATAADIRMAAQTTAAQITGVLPKLPADSPLRGIDAALKTLAAAPDATLMAANVALTEFLPAQLDRLRTVLQAQKVTSADVPPDLARDWILPDGRARVQVLPVAAAQSAAGLRQFVDQVRTVAPDTDGPAATIVETAGTIVGAFRSAAIYALLAIATILAIALRRAKDVVLVMAPLILGALMTALVVVVCGIALNFANIIALPLLLGVGVSFNVYFVMNHRAGIREFLGTGTARAIIFSALTTGSAFGTLALSGERGTASMGLLLVISLACTLVSTLLFEPTLLRAVPAERQPTPAEPG